MESVWQICESLHWFLHQGCWHEWTVFGTSRTVIELPEAVLFYLRIANEDHLIHQNDANEILDLLFPFANDISAFAHQQSKETIMNFQWRISRMFTSFFLTTFWIVLALQAKLIVETVSSKWTEAGVMAQTMTVYELPPRAGERILLESKITQSMLDCSNYLVSLESRKGICRLEFPSLKRRIHFPKVNNDLLICPKESTDYKGKY